MIEEINKAIKIINQDAELMVLGKIRYGGVSILTNKFQFRFTFNGGKSFNYTIHEQTLISSRTLVNTIRDFTQEALINHSTQAIIMDKNMIEHELKTWPIFFQDVWDENKTFEIRRDDRNFCVGDRILLREYDKDTGYSGRELLAGITSKLSGSMEQFGLMDGFCILSIKVLIKFNKRFE